VSTPTEPNVIAPISPAVPEAEDSLEQLTDAELQQRVADGYLALNELVDEMARRKAQRGGEQNITQQAA